jgi:hypothetical protein
VDVVASLRRQAAELRALAASEADPELRRDLLELAERCERLANHIGGNGRDGAG